MAASNLKRLRPDSDDDEHTTSIFTSQETFERYLVIKSKDEDKPKNAKNPVAAAIQWFCFMHYWQIMKHSDVIVVKQL